MASKIFQEYQLFQGYFHQVQVNLLVLLGLIFFSFPDSDKGYSSILVIEGMRPKCFLCLSPSNALFQGKHIVFPSSVQDKGFQDFYGYKIEKHLFNFRKGQRMSSLGLISYNHRNQFNLVTKFSTLNCFSLILFFIGCQLWKPFLLLLSLI